MFKKQSECNDFLNFILQSKYLKLYCVALNSYKSESRILNHGKQELSYRWSGNTTNKEVQVTEW